MCSHKSQGCLAHNGVGCDNHFLIRNATTPTHCVLAQNPQQGELPLASILAWVTCEQDRSHNVVAGQQCRRLTAKHQNTAVGCCGGRCRQRHTRQGFEYGPYFTVDVIEILQDFSDGTECGRLEPSGIQFSTLRDDADERLGQCLLAAVAQSSKSAYSIGAQLGFESRFVGRNSSQYCNCAIAREGQRAHCVVSRVRLGRQRLGCYREKALLDVGFDGRQSRQWEQG